MAEEAQDGLVTRRQAAEKMGVTQTRAIKLLKQPDWHDLGPTFASEQLDKRHSIQVSKETVRAWVISAGLWQASPRKLSEVHQWRPRRSPDQARHLRAAQSGHLGHIAPH